MVLVRQDQDPAPFMHGLAFKIRYFRKGRRFARKVYILMPFNLPVRLLWRVYTYAMRAGFWLKHG